MLQQLEQHNPKAATQDQPPAGGLLAMRALLAALPWDVLVMKRAEGSANCFMLRASVLYPRCLVLAAACATRCLDVCWMT